jgi:arylsulfatase
VVFPAAAQQKKPNILIIMGDDVGYWNISAYNRGMEGYKTPNIDRLYHEGAIFTDYYSQQSCTAGRAAFITGQSPIRTGLTKVGLPGAKEGLSAKDPTIAELLKPQGYMTGQFGKNHLGDRSEFLPTVLGFDEFYGNLYHLNAEEERELPGDAMDCKASNTDDATVDPRFGRVGRQVCKDTGPLTKKRMETVDDDIVDRAVDFMTRRGYEQVGVIKRPVVVGVRHLPREVGFPQRQKAASFNLDDVMKKMSESSGSK